MTTIIGWLKKEFYDQSAEKHFVRAPSESFSISNETSAVNGTVQGRTIWKQLVVSKQNCTRLPGSNRFGDWSVFINLRQSRVPIVSQIYTSVLKTKVKLIEYAFETLPHVPWRCRLQRQGNIIKPWTMSAANQGRPSTDCAHVINQTCHAGISCISRFYLLHLCHV